MVIACPTAKISAPARRSEPSLTPTAAALSSWPPAWVHVPAEFGRITASLCRQSTPQLKPSRQPVSSPINKRIPSLKTRPSPTAENENVLSSHQPNGNEHAVQR